MFFAAFDVKNTGSVRVISVVLRRGEVRRSWCMPLLDVGTGKDVGGRTQKPGSLEHAIFDDGKADVDSCCFLC